MAKDGESILETATEEGHVLESRFILALTVEEIEAESDYGVEAICSMALCNT